MPFAAAKRKNKRNGMSVEYGLEVGDGGEGEHILGLRMHKAHFLS